MTDDVTLGSLQPADLVGVPLETLIEGDRGVVPAACHALIREGELGMASRLSFVLHDIERHDGATHELSNLYKGVCQIGLGRTELGLKNVARAVGAETLSMEDSILARWALVSAAIAMRDLDLAMRFVDEWGRFEPVDEVRGLLEFVTGLREAGPDGEIPDLLGVDFDGSGGFAAVVRCRIDATASGLMKMGESQLRTIAELMAHWELATPLLEIERELDRREPGSLVRARMARAVGESVQRRLESQETQPRRAVRREDVIVWTTDIEEYSSMSETLEPQQLHDLLSPVFKIIDEELSRVGGMILEFVGDSILVVFNLFEEQSTAEHDVLEATSRCLTRLHAYGALSVLGDLPEIRLGVGICKGPVALGYLGGLRRCHLASLGSTVNVASRIEALTRDLPCIVAVDDSMFPGGEVQAWSGSPEHDYGIRTLGARKMKNIVTPARLFGLDPLVRYWVDFVPMGFVASVEPGVVYLDCGNDCRLGIVDHHTRPGRGDCACEIVANEPGLVLEHLSAEKTSRVEFRLHERPDLDCVASLYVAQEHMAGAPRTELLAALAKYVGRIDQGFLVASEHLDESLYGLFVAHQRLSMQKGGLEDRVLLDAGSRVVDAAMFEAERRGGEPDFTRVFSDRSEWFGPERKWLRDDRDKYLADRDRGMTYEAKVRGRDGVVEGLWLTSPLSALFKLWARNDPRAPGGRGWPWLAVDWSTDGKGRVVISVDPESGTSLAGLGEILEEAEKARREAIGDVRPVEPRRWPADNSDPWYSGQGHCFTIVDSPARGTVLTMERIREIHGKWEP